MPIKVPDNLPAKDILENESIFVMDESRAYTQDIRPLKIAVLNLMPTKQTTEVQLLRLLGNNSLQVEITLMHMETHVSKNTSSEYLDSFYYTFEEIKEDKFDGMIITGAPIEHLEYEQVTYWEELKSILEWTKTNVTSTLHICWGAQAGLYYHYGVPKYPLNEKMFGIFPHTKNMENTDIFRGFDDVFYVPHSRHTEIRRSDIEHIEELVVLSESEISGVYAVVSWDKKQVFVTGHSEYDVNTLRDEYIRDVKKGLDIKVPYNYFPNDDPAVPPKMMWRAHSSLLFNNWLNYYVYQKTPYNLNDMNNESETA